MNRVIYEPGGKYKTRYQDIQERIKNEFGTDLTPGAIVRYEGQYYRFGINYTYWAAPYFEPLSMFSQWVNKRRGRI